MAKFTNALNSMTKKGVKIRRAQYPLNTYLQMIDDSIIRVSSSGKQSLARISSADILADDWKVLREK